MRNSVLFILLVLLVGLSVLAGIRHDTTMRDPLTLLTFLGVLGTFVATIVLFDRRP